jgi:hypothetical protein
MIVESHPIFANRYRWKISKAGVVAEISDESQATAEEARAAGERVMKALLEKMEAREVVKQPIEERANRQRSS